MDYLANRVQVVQINGEHSAWHFVPSGTIQGSCIGPTLLIIYINDITDTIKHSLSFSFADDLKIKRATRSVIDYNYVQLDINSIVSWSLVWKLSLNLDKIIRLLCGSRTVIVPLDCNGLNLMPSLTARDLGIYLSNDLKFDQHIDYIVKSTHYLCHVIFKAFMTRDEEHLKKLLVTNVRPKLEFATQIWCPYFKKDISKIERVQQFYTKKIPILTNLKYEDRLNKLQLSSLEDKRHKFDFVFLYKIIHGMTSYLDLPSLNIHPF